jgi:hypothetical protein
MREYFARMLIFELPSGVIITSASLGCHVSVEAVTATTSDRLADSGAATLPMKLGNGNPLPIPPLAHLQRADAPLRAARTATVM